MTNGYEAGYYRAVDRIDKNVDRIANALEDVAASLRLLAQPSPSAAIAEQLNATGGVAFVGVRDPEDVAAEMRRQRGEDGPSAPAPWWIEDCESRRRLAGPFHEFDEALKAKKDYSQGSRKVGIYSHNGVRA